MKLTVVLSVGLDPGLLRARNLVLRSAGYVVVSAHSIKEAVGQFQVGDFDLVLLCQTIPARERDGLTWWIRATSPGTPVVSVSGQLFSDDVVAGVTVGSSPSALLWGIQEVLINAKNRTARTANPFGEREVDVAQMRKPPRPSTGFEARTRATKQLFAPLSRTG